MIWLDASWDIPRLVQLSVARGAPLKNRVLLSSGTRPVADNEKQYDRNARLPAEPWRPLTRLEHERLITTGSTVGDTNTLKVVKVPLTVSASLRQRLAEGDRDGEELVLRSLKCICDLGPSPHYLGVITNFPGMKTVTVSPEIGLYLGLHIDNWDGLEYAERARSTNRICINVGESDRFFIYLPIVLTDIIRVLSRSRTSKWVPPHRPTVVARMFMKRFPDVPVVRCRIAPGEAYIAPTESLIHDGSSEGATVLDQQLTVRGHISSLANN